MYKVSIKINVIISFKDTNFSHSKKSHQWETMHPESRSMNQLRYQFKTLSLFKDIHRLSNWDKIQLILITRKQSTLCLVHMELGKHMLWITYVVCEKEECISMLCRSVELMLFRLTLSAIIDFADIRGLFLLLLTKLTQCSSLKCSLSYINWFSWWKMI